MPSQMEQVDEDQARVAPDLFHHLSSEAQKRLPNAMKTFIRSLYDAGPQMTSLANGVSICNLECYTSQVRDIWHMFIIGDPHPALYPLAQVDFHVPALSTLGSIPSWLDHSAATQKLSAYNGKGSSAIDLSVAMQYGTGLGINTLLEQFAKLNELLHAPNATTRSIILTLGNADAVTKLYRLLGEPGDTFLVEEYSFCGLTNAPIAQGVHWQPVKIDEMGLIPGDMETILSTWDEAVRGRRPHVLYCIPCVEIHCCEGFQTDPNSSIAPVKTLQAQHFH
jgi:aromatic amino acid aminotransferase I / 2-aminoadipate transaminase